MRILVTGGAGFIGGHLCEKLLRQGNKVFCIDNFISGSRKNLPLDRNFLLIEHDITVPLKEDPGQIDQIYHLASPACPMDFKEIPLQVLWTNAAGTKNMLELACKKNARFLLASDIAVRNSNIDHLEVDSCYSEGKRFAETLAMNYYRHFRFPLKIARIFNVYGPRMRKHAGCIIADLIQSAMMNEPLRIHENGLQSNSFCYVDDIVDGLILLMNQDEFLEPIDFGGSEAISLAELAKKIVEISKSSSMISQTQDSGAAFPALCLDTSFTAKKLGFKPKISLDEGLKKTIEYIGNLKI